MADINQKIICLILLLSLQHSSAKSSKEDLAGAEANGKLEIIKQIKKVNDDGSYTIGYEADDGSFKIESRDVLGNIKGTYGYIDEDGEIKRVSYSTNNSSEVPTNQSEPPSVVQRIPKINKTSSSTKRPSVVYAVAATTQSTPTTTTVIQSIPRRRTTTTTTEATTTPTDYGEFIKAAVEASKSLTTKPSSLYENPYSQSAPARILLQSRPILRTAPEQDESQKSEGQLVRPDVEAVRPTEVPLYRRPSKATLLDSETKPVSEEPENRGNLLRRQLITEKTNYDTYDPRQHLLNLQQSSGGDIIDVYSSSLTTGTPRPLFTTSRPRFASSTSSPTIPRPTIRYAASRQQAKEEDITTTEAVEAQTTTTSSSFPVAQIPANRDVQEALVAIAHPVHGRTVLVPLSQLQSGLAQSSVDQEQQYLLPNEQFLKESTAVQTAYPSSDTVPVYVRRYPPPQKFRPIAVQVDENGYIREMPQYATTPYSVPVRMTQPTASAYVEGQNEVDLIKPPVSTQNFQKLLEQLIIRQSRLEHISMLAQGRHHLHHFDPYQNQPTQFPTFGRRPEADQQNVRYAPSGRHAYLPQTQAAHQRSVAVRPESESQTLYQTNGYPPSYTTESFLPTRRVSRLSHSGQQEDDYLPADVREMLLLRMLQLAINPGLPVESLGNFQTDAATTPRHKKASVRNVEILGEEDDTKDTRSKR